MENLNKLLEIVKELNFKDLENKLMKIKSQNEDNDSFILVPFVGEFSSGKTSLINSLTNSKILEVAAKPTTATIYKIYFGCNKNFATYIDENDKENEIEDLSNIKNTEFEKAKVINIYDTSKDISPKTVIVDTPGLSSGNYEHQRTLINFIPFADAILLAVDINQQITKSIIDFIKTIRLSNRPIYIVLTKSDTKTIEDIKQAKSYIKENIDMPFENMICVSSYKNDLNELYSLLNKIQKEKKDILTRVNKERIKKIIKESLMRLEEIMNVSNLDADYDQILMEQENKLKKLNNDIDKLVRNLEVKIEDEKDKIVKKFSDEIFYKLESIIINKNESFDNSARLAINNTASLFFHNYKKFIAKCLAELSKEKIKSENDVSLISVCETNLDEYEINNISYNLSLDNLGHEFDSAISKGVKLVGGIATETTISIIEDSINVASKDNKNNKEKLDNLFKWKSRIEQTANKLKDFKKELSNENEQQNYDIVQSVVGLVTDSLIGKPKRQKAIRDYIDNSLLPNFKINLTNITEDIVKNIKINFETETSNIVSEIQLKIIELKDMKNKKEQEFNECINKYNEYKKYLLNYKEEK